MFAKTFHCNFSKYLNGVRLNYAVGALENTQDTITNICLECGFESQRTFNRVFKERYKITPREYRKKIRDWAIGLFLEDLISAIGKSYGFVRICNNT